MEETLCSAHSGVINEAQNLKDSNAKLWEVVEKLQNRLPTWATLVISLLTFLLGLAVGFISLGK